nr:NAD(P)-dependent oxidoreductase [Clostridia bacterium]
MKTAVVIGATGHVGSYLTTRLVSEGYKVIAIARGGRKAYTADEPEWKEVEFVQADRKAMCADGTFGKLVASYKPDVVCDTIAYKRHESEELCEALEDNVHMVQIGTIWIYDYKLEVPVCEGHPHNGKTEYGIGKTAIENYLMALAAEKRMKCTVIHPGHISGRGWLPINPQGNLNIQVYEDIYHGREVLLPDYGMPTIHHVHSYDIAGLIAACLSQPEKSNGEVFHSVTPKAVTLRGFAEQLYAHYGHEPKLSFMRWEQFKNVVSARDADCTWDHIRRSPSCSMEKAKQILGFVPKYTTMETIYDALDWQIENGLIK